MMELVLLTNTFVVGIMVLKIVDKCHNIEVDSKNL